MNRDRYTSDRMIWLQQVAQDAELSGMAVRVAATIIESLNRGTGYSYQSQQTMAWLLSATERGVQKGVAELVGRNHVSIDRKLTSTGKWLNHYRPILRPHDVKKANNRSGPQTNNRSSGEANSRSGVIAGEHEQANGGHTNKPAGPTRTTVRTNPLNEPIDKEPSEYVDENHDLFDASEETRETEKGKRAASSGEIDEAFERRFWVHYPRKRAREAARKAYRAIIKGGKASIADIELGVMRFAQERTGQDPKFTPYPATWLNDGGWADEPEQPHGTAPRDRQARGYVPSYTELSIAGMRK